MNHWVGVLLCEPVSIPLMPGGCVYTYVLLLKGIGVVHSLVLRMEDLLSIRILNCISLLAVFALPSARLSLQLTKLISTPRLFGSWYRRKLLLPYWSIYHWPISGSGVVSNEAAPEPMYGLLSMAYVLAWCSLRVLCCIR